MPVFNFQGIPKSSYYKMIDIWFLFLLSLVVFTIICHTIITIILGPESAENKYFSQQQPNKKLFSRRRSGAQSGITQNGSTFYDEDDEEEIEELQNAKTANLFGMGAFAAILVLFNIIFWVYALEEHGNPVEHYLNVKDSEVVE